MSSVHTHPVSEAELLLWADGELSGAAARRLQQHLTGCADCRADLEHREGLLRTFAQARERLSPLTASLPDRWEPLETQIKVWEARWTIASWITRLHEISRPRYYALAGAVVVMLAVIAILFQPWQETVSANELLRRARLAQDENKRMTPGAVMHETLLIRRLSANRERNVTTDYQSWQDGSGHLLRQTLSSREAIAELQRIYQANNLDWQSPLSAAAYERWRSSFTARHDSVASTENNRLTLTTVLGSWAAGDAINKAELVVRSADWRPVITRLWVRDLEYEITELDSTVATLSQPGPSLALPLAAGAIPGPQLAGNAQIKAKTAPSLELLNPLQDAGFSPSALSLPAEPVALKPAPAADEAHSAVVTANHPAYPDAPPGPPSAPGSPMDAVITFAGQGRISSQPIPQSQLPAVTVPTIFPVNVGGPHYHSHVSLPCVKALAGKLGLIKKKKDGPVEPAKPGG